MINSKNPYRILGRSIEILSYGVGERIATVETLLLSEIGKMNIINDRVIQVRTKYQVYNIIFSDKKICADAFDTIQGHTAELPTDNSSQILQ